MSKILYFIIISYCVMFLYSTGLVTLRYEWKKSQIAILLWARSQTKAFFLSCRYNDLQTIPIATECICVQVHSLAHWLQTVGAIEAYIKSLDNGMYYRCQSHRFTESSTRPDIKADSMIIGCPTYSSVPAHCQDLS